MLRHKYAAEKWLFRFLLGVCVCVVCVLVFVFRFPVLSRSHVVLTPSWQISYTACTFGHYRDYMRASVRRHPPQHSQHPQDSQDPQMTRTRPVRIAGGRVLTPSHLNYRKAIVKETKEKKKKKWKCKYMLNFRWWYLSDDEKEDEEEEEEEEAEKLSR